MISKNTGKYDAVKRKNLRIRTMDIYLLIQKRRAISMYLKMRPNIYQIEFVLSTGIKLHLIINIVEMRTVIIMLKEKYGDTHANASRENHF